MFKEFGVVLRIPLKGQLKPTLQSDSFKHYAGLGFLDCTDTVEFGITTFNQRPFDVLQLEQHAKTPELLFAIDGAFAMPVAPIIYQRKIAYPDVINITAIKVNQGEGVIFKDGIWHLAPYPVDMEKSSVLVGFKKGTCEDDIIIRDLKEQYKMVFE